MFQWVIDHQQPLFFAGRVYVQEVIQITPVCAAEVEEIGVKDFAMLLVEAHPAFYHRLGLVRVVEPRTAVTGHDPRAEEVGQALLVVRQVVLQRLDRRRRAAALILGKRHEHPAHARGLFPGAVEDVLALDDFLVGAWERPVHLPVAHAGLGAAGEEIPVGDVQINSVGETPLIEAGDGLPLHPLGIFEAAMERVVRCGAGVARV